MKKHNFYAGPSILSEYTIKNTAAAVENFAGMDLSLLEISHRSKEFVAVNDEARALIKELLDVPAGYEVVFLGGGASMQFCMAPYNLLNKKASYLDTGTWSSKAIKEAKLFGEVEVVASSKDKNYTYIPKDYTIADDTDYFHITTNNTILRNGAPRRSGCETAIGCRYVVRHLLPPGRREQIRHHICRGTEKPGSRRSHYNNRARRCIRARYASYTHNAEL